MADPLRIQIVIPCFNEADRLNCRPFQDFIFVGDGSTDATFQLLETLSRANPEVITVHRLPNNQGKGEAVRQGFLQALRTGKVSPP